MILAIPAKAAASPVKPSNAAITAKTKKNNAQRNIFFSLSKNETTT